MRFPFIVILNLFLLVVGTVKSLSRILDGKSHQLMEAHFNTIIAQFGYFVEVMLLVLSLALLFGYYNKQKWAYKGTFFWYGLYLASLIVGVALLYVFPDQFFAYAQESRGRDLSEVPIAVLQTSMIIVLLIQSLVIFFILRSFYKIKSYFKY